MPGTTVLNQQLKQSYRNLPEAVSYEFQPRNLFLLPDPQDQQTMLRRDVAFLMSINAPMRWVVIHHPTNLEPLIDRTRALIGETVPGVELAHMLADKGLIDASQPIPPQLDRLLAQQVITREQHKALNFALFEQSRLLEYQQFFTHFQDKSSLLKASLGLTIWKEMADPSSISKQLRSLRYGPYIEENSWPQLLSRPETYELRNQDGLWYLEPQGFPAGRPLVTFMRIHSFVPTAWGYHEPFNNGIIPEKWPFGMVWDIPYTYPKQDAVATLEEVKDSQRAGLLGRRGADSGTETQMQHINETLREIQTGNDALHRIRIRLALFAHTVGELQARVETISNKAATHMKIAVEQGPKQLVAYQYFTTKPGLQIEPITGTYPTTSSVLALSLGPTGIPMPEVDPDGVLYGTNELKQPIFMTHWADGKKPALHTTIVGKTGYGKTFFVNTLLQRCWLFQKTPFTLIEPLGHGRKLANALGIEAFTIDPKETVLNPLDPIFEKVEQQTEHTMDLMEMLLRRELAGNERADLQNSVLSGAIQMAYGRQDISDMTPATAPTLADVIEKIKAIATAKKTLPEPLENWEVTQEVRDAANSLSVILQGKLVGSIGYFTNGHTRTNYALQDAEEPRIYCLDQLGENRMVVALAYLQIFVKEWRLAMRDEKPRNLVLDEVGRLNVHPTLPKFITRVAKTLRTKRGRLIVIDQDIDTFLQPDMLQVFTNCPWHVYFNQSGNEETYARSPRFADWSKPHKDLLSRLSVGQYLLQHQDYGLQWMYAQATPHEIARFGSS